MFQQRQRELEKQYNQQVKDIKAKKMAGQSSKKAVSSIILVAGEGAGGKWWSADVTWGGGIGCRLYVPVSGMLA